MAEENRECNADDEGFTLVSSASKTIEGYIAILSQYQYTTSCEHSLKVIKVFGCEHGLQSREHVDTLNYFYKKGYKIVSVNTINNSTFYNAKVLTHLYKESA